VPVSRSHKISSADPQKMPDAGCGKTLIARKIGKMLCDREPKIVNGPELLNAYVGQSEENVRNLFADAKREYAEVRALNLSHQKLAPSIDPQCFAL
jgi:vesicle-fusing ATPase